MQHKPPDPHAHLQILIKNLTENLLFKIRTSILSHHGDKICVILAIKSFLAVAV